MVRGLFPRCEQETVLGLLGRSVVFLTPSNIVRVLRETRWPKTAWDLANRYLARFDADEYTSILREAVLARNGWKRIRERCSPPRPARRPILAGALPAG